MINYIKIYDLIGFKLCWILCAFSTKWGSPYLGPIITLIFILIHLGYIWLTYQKHNFYVNETYYDVLLRSEPGYLNHTPTAIFYMIAIFFIGFHLKHGYQSALKTFGLLNSKASHVLYSIGFIFWGLIPLGFIIIVLSIQLGFIY